MSILLALGAALAWGSSDFAAGHTSRSTSAVSVTVLTHLASAVALLAVVRGGTPTLGDLGWGLAAGLGGGVGAMFLFRGLGRGSMAVVAPITASGAAVIPVGAGVALGESLSSTAGLGLALALGAIVLISLTAGEPDAVEVPGVVAPATGSVAVATVRDPVRRRVLDRPGIGDALVSGVGFGLFFVCISRAGEDAGYWPLVAAHGLSAGLFAMVALATVVPVIPHRSARRPVVLAGVLDAVAAVLFVASTRSGLLSIGAVLASLYPAATVVLARVVVKERIAPRQVVGLAAAAGAVALLAL